MRWPGQAAEICRGGNKVVLARKAMTHTDLLEIVTAGYGFVVHLPVQQEPFYSFEYDLYGKKLIDGAHKIKSKP